MESDNFIRLEFVFFVLLVDTKAKEQADCVDTLKLRSPNERRESSKEAIWLARRQRRAS